MEFTSRQLRAFHLVAQHRNFTRAAEVLFITPSGLSVLIRELERQLRFRIFDRTTRQVSLTAQGSELLAVTRPALNALEEEMSRIGQTARRKNRRISIGTTPRFAAHVLPPAIKEFRDGHADLQVHLFDGNLGAIMRRVAANKLDFAVGIFDRMPAVQRVPFFRFSLMLVRPDDGQTIRYNTSQWSELRGETLISLTKNYPHATHPPTTRQNGNSLQARSDGEFVGHADRIIRGWVGGWPSFLRSVCWPLGIARLESRNWNLW